MAEDQNKKAWRAEIPEDDDYEEERLRRKWEREQELKNTQRERRFREQKRKLRAIMILAVTAALLIVLLTVLTVKVFIPLARYHSACQLLGRGEYAEAIVAFRNMAGYKDSDALLDEAIRLQAVKLTGREDVVYSTSADMPWFSISESGELSFSEDRYRGDWSILIPDVFDGVLVQSLAKNMFAHYDLVSVKISECVLSIGDLAFLDCTSLTSVVLPPHLTSIGEGAFEGCTALSTVTFGEEVVSIGEDAFKRCTSLTEVTLPSALVTIKGRAFNACTALRTVTLGGALETLGPYAFSACTALERVQFRGTEAEWSAICTDPARVGVENAEIRFGAEEE